MYIYKYLYRNLQLLREKILQNTNFYKNQKKKKKSKKLVKVKEFLKEKK